MHLRMPSIDKGVQSFLWAAFFFLYIFFGMKAVGVDGATSLIVALVSSFLIFLFIRTRERRQGLRDGRVSPGCRWSASSRAAVRAPGRAPPRAVT